jgi:hypothetical protein
VSCIRVNGVGGLQLVVDQVGIMEEFSTVYTSKHTKVCKGQMVKKTMSRMSVVNMLRHTDKNLKIYMDIMHVGKEIFLVSVPDPLNLALQYKIENESRNMMGLGLQGHLAILRLRNFNLAMYKLT